VAENDETPPAEGGASAKAPRSRVRVYVAVAVIAVLVLLVFPVYSTLQPAYYERYPSLRVRMDSWKMSTHARIPCAGCHVDPGPMGLVRFSARAIPDFYSQLIFGPRQTNLLHAPDRQACQKCHTSYRQVSPAGDLLIPHRAHVVVLGINCVVCHKNLVHSPNSQGFNKPEMQTCLNLCHNGKTATNQCTKCHTQKQTPPSHKRADWLVIHSQKVGTINCGQCHGWTPDFCTQCHSKRPASHVGNWKQLHQFRARQLGVKGCLVCHGGEKFCKTCH
jgi:hypothetical protein